MNTIRITPLLQAQIDRVLRAADLYPNADEGVAPLEVEHVTLAEEFMREYARQVVGRARPAKAGLAIRQNRRHG